MKQKQINIVPIKYDYITEKWQDENRHTYIRDNGILKYNYGKKKGQEVQEDAFYNGERINDNHSTLHSKKKEFENTLTIENFMQERLSYPSFDYFGLKCFYVKPVNRTGIVFIGNTTLYGGRIENGKYLPSWI